MKYLSRLFLGTLALLMFNNNTYSGIKVNNYLYYNNVTSSLNYLSAILQIGNIEFSLLRNDNINNNIQSFYSIKDMFDIQHSKENYIKSALNLNNNYISLPLIISESYSLNNLLSMTNANEILHKTYIMNTMLTNDINNTLNIINNISNSDKNKIFQNLNTDNNMINKVQKDIKDFQNTYNFIYNLHFNDTQIEQIHNNMKDVLDVAFDYFALEEQLLNELGVKLTSIN